MSQVCVPFPSLEFQRDNKCFIASFVVTGDLDSCIDVALEPVHRGPNMLLNFKQFINTQSELGIIAILNKRVRLFRQLVRVGKNTRK